MVHSFAQVTADALALALPVEEREQLVDRLLESMDADGEAPISEAWAAEIERRIQEIDDGVETFPAEEVFAELREELRRKSA